jgi:DNA-binding response OmpR family regulator
VAKKQILFVDNNRDFLDTLAEYINQAGYKVIKAYSAEDARSYGEQLKPDLAVVDVRLVNDDDEHDRTGVFLAETLREICPVIMLTDHTTSEVVRLTLRPDVNDRSVAVDFVDKREGPGELIQAVQRALLKSSQTSHRLFGPKSFWRFFRIAAFIVLCIPLVIAVLLVIQDNNLGLIIGLIFGGLQVLVGVAGWLFEKRS